MTGGRAVRVINLGRMGYLQAGDLQVRYAREHLDHLAGRAHARGRDTLLLVEHNPVYTIGVRTQDYDEIEEVRLKKLGAEFYRTNRGGLITYHGPGQLVAYPIVNLRHFTPSMAWYIKRLEATLINTCRRFGVPAKTTQHTGVWVGDRKIASIGVHGSRYITTHGISLNCDTDLTWFRHVTPCGIKGKDVTSLTRERGTDTPLRKVIAPFLAAFEEEFDCTIEFNMFDSGDNDLLRNFEEEEERRGVKENSASPSSSPAPPMRAQQMR